MTHEAAGAKHHVAADQHFCRDDNKPAQGLQAYRQTFPQALWFIPTTDTSLSSTQAITRFVQPNFAGSSQPFSTVFRYETQAGGGQSLPIGPTKAWPACPLATIAVSQTVSVEQKLR